MNDLTEPKSQRKTTSLGKKLWMGFLFLLAGLVYSPWVVPYGRYEPFILGLPYTLFWWMVLSFLLMVGIVLFAAFGWREENEEGGGD